MKLFRKAVLIIHGFSAELSDNEFLMNQLEFHSNFDVYAWTLPAHEKYILNKVKYSEWVDAVDFQVENLIKHGYHTIYVVGHSMGGLLAGYLASKYKQIKKVVFLSAAYDYFSGDQYKSDFRSLKALSDSDASYKNILFKVMKVPFSTVMEFRKLVRKYRNCIKEVYQSCLILYGDKDEVVPYATMEYIKKNIGSKKTTFTTVKNGRHVMLRGRRQEEVIQYIEAYLIGGRKWKQMKKSEL